MTRALNQILAARRREIGLTQKQAAELIGITRSTVAQIESGLRIVNPKHLDAFAGCLGLDADQLRVLNVPRPTGRPTTLALRPLPDDQRRPVTYDVVDTIEAMLARGGLAQELSDCVRNRLGTLRYADMCRNFPRDSVLELLAAHQKLAFGGSLHLLRPLQDLGCLLPICLHAEDVYAGHRPTYAIVVIRSDTTVVSLPQVSLMAKKQGKTYRCDFLTLVYNGKAERWLDIEYDGRVHDDRAAQDALRSYGLGLTRLGYSWAQVLRPTFAQLWWNDVTSVLRRRIEELEQEKRAHRAHRFK